MNEIIKSELNTLPYVLVKLVLCLHQRPQSNETIFLLDTAVVLCAQGFWLCLVTVT